jgi:2-polyprenyl-6-methoxyphenol hydroxylase-like FAD-dependent oxidoreductase
MSVIIAGAGPTGLLLAGDLAAAGVSVTVLEKRAEGISNLTRAFGVHARTLELLDARGLADSLVPTGQVIGELRLFGSIPFDITQLPSRFPFLLVTPQYEVEKLLLRRAQDNGVVFRYGTEVTGVSQDAEGVTVFAGDTEFKASYLVGADGVRSAVRESIGLPFPGHAVIRSVVLADVKLVDEPSITVRVHGVGDAFGFIAPFGDGYWRIGGWDRANRGLPDSAPVEFEELRSITERAFGTDYGMHSPRWLARFHSDERQVPSYRVGRVLLAGDAAHQHSPAGGQGMNTGLQDAANLSWKLAAVVTGRASDSLLDSYHTERHPIGRAVLRSSGLNLRLAMAHNPFEVALRFVRSLIVKNVRPVSRAAIGQITGIGYGYPAVRGSHRLAGKRTPDFELQNGRLYEALRAGKFVLICPQGFKVSVCENRHVVAHWPDERRDALLVRPDGYTAWAADSPDITEIESAAQQWTAH